MFRESKEFEEELPKMYRHLQILPIMTKFCNATFFTISVHTICQATQAHYRTQIEVLTRPQFQT